MKADQVLVRHILDAINHIEQYADALNKEAFLTNFLVQDAVVRNLEIIGEASRNITQSTKNNFPEIPWRDVNAMRNKLIHEYFRTDAETVWNVIELDLPELKSNITKILNS